MTWLGQKKVAFLPVSRPGFDDPPANWAEQIEARLYATVNGSGIDLSLRNYIYTTSYGKGDIIGEVLPVIEIPRQHVEVDDLESEHGEKLRARGFDAAALVMLGGVGAGTASGNGFWARFVMDESLGVWSMELMHAIARYWDLYNEPNHLESFDNMACNCGTHPSAFTKRVLGWIDPATIAHQDRRFRDYKLHTLSLVQPPPSGRVCAVQVGERPPYLMIESRRRTDQFDSGIGSEGVIVYEVRSADTDPGAWIRPSIRLWTPTALQPGQNVTVPSGVTVQVTLATAAGFDVRVTDPRLNVVFEPGQLLFYRDSNRDGTGDVANPSVIGLGGWQAFSFVFSGGDGIIYAVDGEGRLLFYRDTTQDGMGDVSSPSIIGLGGWQNMRHLFAGDPGVIYAVDQQGRLLFYRDQPHDGTGQVANPSVIGTGGWQAMRRLFYGGDGIIYAVDQQGRLLFYRDANRDGTGDVANPSVIGQGGWQDMLHLFSGGEGIIYAVDQQGRLLFYRDANRDGSGDIAHPSVIGLGGWKAFEHLFAGEAGIIYAVVSD